MARPTKLTPDRQERILEALRAGVHHEVAAQYGGIHVATFYDWIARGEAAIEAAVEDQSVPDSERIYVEFAEAVTRTEIELEIALVTKVNLATGDDWRAAVELLRRRHPSRWGNVTRVVGPDGGPVRVDVDEVAPAAAVVAKLDELAERRARRAASQ